MRMICNYFAERFNTENTENGGGHRERLIYRRDAEKT
jgi:hypothetical protein